MRMLILSGKKALQKEIEDISLCEQAIAFFMKEKRDYTIEFLYYDEPNKFKIRPVKRRAQSIRAFVSKIEEKWGTIDFLLLVGGDSIVPFFRLENPCDDSDASVLSDNPYASQDDNFLIPERVCARIPDNKNAHFIAQQFKKRFKNSKKSFGITAKIWKEASENVYQRIGNIKDLKVSPPVTSDKFKLQWLQNKDFLYFNLHGSKVSPNWYGQDGSQYPVALSPENIIHATGIATSESCYGAYILKKSHRDAISLRFLSQDDIYGFCGSTTISYGPISPPSSEADLLVKYFFDYIKQGLTIGESFKNAKIDFARKALRRHGFLDDDDQKTLLQFVLYGDPTIRFEKRTPKTRAAHD